MTHTVVAKLVSNRISSVLKLFLPAQFIWKPATFFGLATNLFYSLRVNTFKGSSVRKVSENFLSSATLL